MGNMPGKLISMRGTIDLHSHPAPCLFPRRSTDYQIAEAASEAGMGGLMLKCHHESTVSRAFGLRRDFPHLYIFGGIVLNRYVGGYNPKAVEAALELGGKQVWLPTVDAAYHAEVHGSTGRYDVQDSGGAEVGGQGISALQDGQLTPEAKAIFELIAEHNAILGTCHQSYDELKIIIPAARAIGVQKILLTHPFFKVPGLSLEQTKELVKLGAIAEFGYCTVSPMWAYADCGKVAQAVQSIGAENCVLISDAGQRHNPLPSEALFLFAQSLFEKGVSKQDINTMIKINPARLLDIDLDSLEIQAASHDLQESE
jgi:hypothetical protein